MKLQSLNGEISMAKEPISRRDFIGGLAASGATATAAIAANGISPSDAVVVTSFPVYESKPSPGPIRVVCAEKLTSAELEQIRAAAPNIDLVVAGDRSDLKEKARDAEVILGVVDAETVLNARQLKWVQTWHAGVETLPKGLMEHHCVLTNMQRVFAPVIAESAIAMMLSLTRGLAQSSIPNFKQRKYSRVEIALEDLYGKTLGLVGLGGIGTETAQRVHHGFNMKVLALDAKPLPRPEFVAELHEPGWLMQMVPQADILMSAAPLTKETQKMFNEAVFRKMKRTAYFINVSRGGLVDQEALAQALKQEWIRGAGLDVTTPEPLPPDHFLWDCPNLVITPHNSGYAPSRQIRLIALVAENVRRYASGLPLLNVVDKVRGY
jgi:phosphoglycerate dehydrogenase-like enzyme